MPTGERGASEDPFWRLLRVFVDDDGAPRFALEDVRHFLPWCIAHLPIDVALLDDAPREIFAAACDAAGVPSEATRDEICARLDAWYAEHRPNPTLAAAVQEAWRGIHQDTAAQTKLASFLGDGAATGVLGGGGPRPAGTVPGGPLARLLATGPKTGPSR